MKKKLEETAVYDEYVRWCGRSKLAKANSSYPIIMGKAISGCEDKLQVREKSLMKENRAI
jgi:hypothetical protein